MQVTIEQRPKSEVRLRVELEPAELARDLDVASGRIAAIKKFPGFRPGKAPYAVVAQQVGEQAVWEEAVDDIVRRTFVAVVRDHKLSTVGAPKIEVEKLAPGNPLIYTAIVALYPSLELADYAAPFGLQPAAVVVSDEDVAKSIDQLRELMASERPVERPAQTGDRVELDVDVFVDQVPIEGGKSRSHPVKLGSGSFVPGFEEQVTGMTANQSKEFKLRFPKDYHQRSFAGKEAEFRVKATKVAEIVLPALEDAFAAKASGLKTVAELRERIRKDLETERRRTADQEFEAKLVGRVIEKSKFGPLPDLLVDHEVERMLDELKHDVEEHGMKFPDYLASMKQDEASMQRELRPRAEHRVKSSLVVRAIAEREHVTVSETDITREIDALKLSVPADDPRRDELDGEEFRRYTATVLTNRKAIDALRLKQGQKEGA